MRDKVSFEKPVRTKNPTTGSTVDSFVVVANRQALIAPVSGNEFNSSGGEVTAATAIITVRYDRLLEALSNEWRIVDNRNNRIYDIEYTDPITISSPWIKIRCIHRSK
jgi:SPP1 family predicted phage head-tail adaptor